MENISLDFETTQELLDNSYDGIWITDGEGRVLYVNAANLALLGLTKEDILGKTTEELLANNILTNSVVLDAIRFKHAVSRTCYNSKTNLTVLATASPIFDKDGNIKYIINNVRDVTTLIKLQDSLLSKEETIRLQKAEIQNMKSRLGHGGIIANSKKFVEIIALAERVSNFDKSTALILGESGTGKEVIAKYIVKNSQRHDKPFLKINCGSIPENLIESELFGYEKGSFTGADAAGKMGLFEAANSGTVFLDEIGDLPIQLQGKLLRVLQEKSVTRIGSHTPIPLDVKIIAATNRNLFDDVKANSFREDLYYRLNVVTLKLPPLRERTDDIIPLAYHFLQSVNQKYGVNKSFGNGTLQQFLTYEWPGNVRELENLVESLVITSVNEVITVEDLPDNMRPTNYSAEYLSKEILPLNKAICLLEADLINRALNEYGSLRKAARALEVDPSTLTRKLKKIHNLKEADN